MEHPARRRYDSSESATWAILVEEGSQLPAQHSYTLSLSTALEVDLEDTCFQILCNWIEQVFIKGGRKLNH